MRSLCAALALILSISIQGQPCLVNTPWPNNSITEWLASDMRSDGSIMGVLAINDGLGDALAFHLDPAGQIVWAERIMPTNPKFDLIPVQVIATTSGGMLIFGYVDHGNYINQFGILLDNAGAIQWARLYMMHTSNDGYLYQGTRIAELPNGGFLLSQSHWLAFHQIEIDPNGVPMVGTGYSAYDFNLPWNGYANYSTDMITEPNGDRVLVGMSDAVPWILKTDDQGQVLFANRYNVGLARPVAVTKASNGDYIVVGQTELNPTGLPFAMRVDGSGAFLWMRTYGTTDERELSDVAELPNGELLMTMNKSRVLYNALVPGSPQDLLHTAANGVTLGHWEHGGFSSPEFRTELVGLRGDSIVLGMTQEFSSINSAPAILYAQDINSLGCGLNTATINDALQPPPTSVTPSIFTKIDSIKTWTMHMSLLDMNSLDMIASLASGPARPGFDMTYYGQVINIGGLASGPIDITFDFDSLLTFVGATPAGYTVVGNQVSWTGLPPAQSLTAIPVEVGLTVDPDPGNLGTLIPGVLHVTQPILEAGLANNTDTLYTMITGAYDPNDKLVSPENVFDPLSDSLLNYTIRFQNTGIDTAFNVVIVDTLPAEVSVSTFMAGPSSHSYTYTLEASGILTFTFNNILLPDSFVNEPASHGLVKFSIRPDDNLMIGTMIGNSADIYFDFNPPIRTPPADVVYGIVTSAPLVLRDRVMTMYPVPVDHSLTVLLPEGFNATRMVLTALDGRMAHDGPVQQVTDKLLIKVDHLPAGAYIMNLLDDNGERLMGRFVKE